MKAIFSALVAMGALAASPAFATERAPNAEELTAIESALKAQGFTAWTDVDLDENGLWDIDHAKHTDGKVYDVSLKAGSYEVVTKVLED